MTAARNRTRKVAVLGSASFLGARVLRRLAREARDEVLAIDIAAPPAALDNVRHCRLDLTRPDAGHDLLALLRDEDVGTLLHFAFFTNPRRDTAYSHELESIGTLSVFAAAAAAGVEHVVMRSFTAVYGARGQNPNFLTEERALPAAPDFAWLRDKLEAEQHAAACARRYPKLNVTVLRFAPLFGPGVQTFYTGVFDKRVVPMVMGYDPLLQLLHPEDAEGAVTAALTHRPRGAVNVVPSRALPLLTALLLAEKVPLPVPHGIAYAGADLLWSAGLAAAPGGFVDYARFLFVADGARAAREMGFTARHTSRAALESYLGYRHPTRPARLREVEA